MRLAWVVSISPDIINKIVRPELSTWVIGLIEIIRRSVWNFLRVEKEHLANVGSFKAVPDLQLPYDDIVFKNRTQTDYFNIELEKIMHNDNKSEKPISMGSYLPYRTTVASLAENYNRLNNPTSEINLMNLYKNSNKSAFKHFSSIPFKATALGNLSEEERGLLLQELQNHREEEAKKYKIWAKEVESFKQTLKVQESRFVVIDVDNDPLVIPETLETDNESHKPTESERELIPKNKDSKLQDFMKKPTKNRPLPHRYMSVVTQRKSSYNPTEENKEAEDALKQKRRNTASAEKIKDFFSDVMKQEKSLWGHSPKSPKKPSNFKQDHDSAKKDLTHKNPTSIVLEIPQIQTQTSIPNVNKESRVLTSVFSEESRVETNKTADELSPPKHILNLASSNQNSGSSSNNSSPDDHVPLSPPTLSTKVDSQDETENTDSNQKKNEKKLKKRFNKISPEK